MACGAIWASAHERGMKHLGEFLMPMAYEGAHGQKSALFKPWGASIVAPWNSIAGLGLSEMSWY